MRKVHKVTSAEAIAIKLQRDIRLAQADQIERKLQSIEIEARKGNYLIDFTYGNNGVSS
jgi:hypothetical protein